MIVNLHGKKYEVTVKRSTYMKDDSLAIFLIDANNDEPFATLTVWISDPRPGFEYAYVDTNNCPWAEKFIEDNQLGVNTGLMGFSGWCAYPLYRFNVDLIQEAR